MDQFQFQQLIQELQIMTTTIVEKLEEIRCGIIDVETATENPRASALPIFMQPHPEK